MMIEIKVKRMPKMGLKTNVIRLIIEGLGPLLLKLCHLVPIVNHQMWLISLSMRRSEVRTPDNELFVTLCRTRFSEEYQALTVYVPRMST